MAVFGASPAGAASAYTQAAQRVLDGGAGGVETGGAEAKAPSFANMLSDAITGMVDVNKSAESASIKSLGGKGDIVDLVTAVNNAEMTMQTVVAVRDRVVQAYQDIMRMPI